MCQEKSADARPSRDAGFTLVELLITVVVLIVGIVSVAQLVPISIASNLRNRNDSTALIAAQSLMEQMQEQSLTATTAGCPNGNPPVGHYGFCDLNGYGIGLGINTLATDPEGCTPPNALGRIDFTLPATSCAGYTQTENGIELRWTVITLNTAAGGTPYRKVFIVAGRQGGAAIFSNVTANLMSVVGKQ
jgi:type II secretory pathway pseudopilin PulG